GALWLEGSDIRYTRTKDKRTVHAFALAWPGEKLVLHSVQPVGGSPIQMLGSGAPLKWSAAEGGGVEVQMPAGMQDESQRPCRFAWGFKIRTEPA
ncbi:MAG: alpha-L-fucosidase C-terminal domain-containing protein, partial [Bryobacteraceae bacterium]